MAEATQAAGPLPVVDFLKIPAEGEPYLEGHRCKKCSAMYLGPRQTCAKCSAQGEMEAVRLSNRGELYSFSIVYRSFPGIDTPYISAIVDLEGGGTVKGNLVDIEADPKNIEFGMPVEVVYRDALGRKDKEGNSYLSYFFKPRS